MLVSNPGLMSREISTIPCPFFLSALTGSNLSLTTQSPSSYSRRNLIFRMNSPSGRAARSLAALPSVIRAFKAIRPARVQYHRQSQCLQCPAGLLLQPPCREDRGGAINFKLWRLSGSQTMVRWQKAQPDEGPGCPGQ